MSGQALPSDDAAQLQAELAQARQRLAEMAAAQEAFMRRVVHDLRAPLRHVTSYGALVRELLAELPSPPMQVAEALECVATMEQSARRMALMLDGLRAIADAERAPLRPGPVPLPAVLHEARAALAGQEAGRAVHWDCQLDAALPPLQADAQWLRTLLVQLLGNALKFTRGRAAAHIGVRAERAGPGQVRITVQDNGAGFDPERAGQLFGVFERLQRDSEFEGVGAGLALCQAIARRHGAHLGATARPDAGCTVQLLWPAAAAPHGGPEGPAAG